MKGLALLVVRRTGAFTLGTNEKGPVRAHEALDDASRNFRGGMNPVLVEDGVPKGI